MPFHNTRRPHDRYSSPAEVRARAEHYRTSAYRWWSKARKGDLPGLPPLCQRWATEPFQTFLLDLGIDPARLATELLEFAVAPDATEISPRTCRLANTTPRRLNRTTRRTLGLDQAAHAVARLTFTCPTPDTVRIQGRFGKQRPDKLKTPVTRQTLMGSFTSLEPAPLDPRYTNPLWGQDAFTPQQWRSLILPRLINLVDHLATYLQPTGRQRNGLPVHQGWVPFTSAASGYDKPDELSDLQWQAWRQGLIDLFAAPTPSPTTQLGGFVPERDFSTLFKNKAAADRQPFITTTKGGARIYRPGPFKTDRFWTLTKPTDVKPRSIHLTLLGDLAEVTHTLRWALIARYPHPVAFDADTQDYEDQLPPPMQYKAQLAYLQVDGPAYANSDLGFAGNAEGFARFPATFHLPNPNDPDTAARYCRMAESYNRWRQARTVGQTIWPPPRQACDELGLVEYTPSGAVKFIYLPMRTHPYTFHEGGDGDNGGNYRPRPVDWRCPPHLRIPDNPFVRSEVLAFFKLMRVWHVFWSRRTHRRVDKNSPFCLPLGPHYFHPLTLPAYDFVRRHVNVGRNPYNPETGLPARPSPGQVARAQAKREARQAERQARQTLHDRLNLDHLGRPLDWDSPYHPQSFLVQEVCRLAFIRRRRQRLTYETLHPKQLNSLQLDVQRLRSIQRRRITPN